jgi:hypothetical protein
MARRESFYWVETAVGALRRSMAWMDTRRRRQARDADSTSQLGVDALDGLRGIYTWRLQVQHRHSSAIKAVPVIYLEWLIDGGEGGIRTLSTPLESVSYGNHVAAIAMNAVAAVAHCTRLHHGAL